MSNRDQNEIDAKLHDCIDGYDHAMCDRPLPTESLYPLDPSKCVCGGTGVIKFSERDQSYCPTHSRRAKWHTIKRFGESSYQIYTN